MVTVTVTLLLRFKIYGYRYGYIITVTVTNKAAVMIRVPGKLTFVFERLSINIKTASF
jgi:hypothetical protein